MQMAASVVANEFVGHGTKQKSKPRPFKTERAGHPEKRNQSLGVDVLEWYYPIVRVRQQNKHLRVGHPPRGSVQYSSANYRNGVILPGVVARTQFLEIGIDW
jgi:hypothetical protein